MAVTVAVTTHLFSSSACLRFERAVLGALVSFAFKCVRSQHAGVLHQMLASNFLLCLPCLVSEIVPSGCRVLLWKISRERSRSKIRSVERQLIDFGCSTSHYCHVTETVQQQNSVGKQKVLPGLRIRLQCLQV